MQSPSFYSELSHPHVSGWSIPVGVDVRTSLRPSVRPSVRPSFRPARKDANGRTVAAKRRRGKISRREDMFNVIAGIAADSLDGELRVYGMHRYNLWIEAGGLTRATSTDPKRRLPSEIFDAALATREGFFDFVPALASIRSITASSALRLPLETLLCTAAADRVAVEAPTADPVENVHAVDDGRALLGAFNEVLSEIFDTIANHGDTARTSAQVQELVLEADLSAYIGALQDRFHVPVESTLAAIERCDTRAPSTVALYEMLHHVVSCALFAAGRSVPRQAEMALAKRVHQRLHTIDAPCPALYVARH